VQLGLTAVLCLCGAAVLVCVRCVCEAVARGGAAHGVAVVCYVLRCAAWCGGGAVVHGDIRSCAAVCGVCGDLQYTMVQGDSRHYAVVCGGVTCRCVVQPYSLVRSGVRMRPKRSQRVWRGGLRNGWVGPVGEIGCASSNSSLKASSILLNCRHNLVLTVIIGFLP
jgi:hypothetical protein